MKVCVIPARAGSKRIPFKNINGFAGMPMLCRAVTTALQSGLFDLVVVSTEDEQVAAIARECGASVPFIRPASLADDHTGIRAVIRHAITALEGHVGKGIDRVCCLLATTPLLLPGDLHAADALLDRHGGMVLSVCACPAPVERVLYLDLEGRVQRRFPEHAATRSQDLQTSYFDAGQFYYGLRDVWMESGRSVTAGSMPCILPPSRVVDIDSPADWEHAEQLYRVLHPA